MCILSDDTEARCDFLEPAILNFVFSEWQRGFFRIQHKTLWTYSCQI